LSRLPIEHHTQLGDDLAPNFDISISGRDASKASALFDAVRPLIAGVAYEEDEEMSSMFELHIVNQPDTSPGLRANWRAVVDSKAFQEGNTVDLWMGYGGVRQYMGRVDLVRWLPVFPSEGPATFTIKGYDGRHKMQNENRVRAKSTLKTKRKVAWRGMPDEEIVRKIAAKYGYGADTDPTEVKRRSKIVKRTSTVERYDESGAPVFYASSTHKVVESIFPTRPQPADMTDWAFLRKLAKINRFDLWVEWSETKRKYIVNFKRRQDAGSPEYLFTYNGRDGSLISAEPDFAIQDQTTDVEVFYFDKKRKKIERTVINDINPAEDLRLSTATVGNFEARKEISKGARVRFSAFGQSIEAIADRPFRNKKDAETFVRNWLKERERDFLTLRGKVVGLETLRPRQIHQFEGLSTRLGGFYRLTQVRHEMLPGQQYQCAFTAYKVLSQEVARRARTTKVRMTSAMLSNIGKRLGDWVSWT